MTTIGRRRWAIAEGYIPGDSAFDDPALISHETACLLNAGDTEARVGITLYFSDRDYACVIESDMPIVVQHTRMDSRKAEIALLSTIAYSEG